GASRPARHPATPGTCCEVLLLCAHLGHSFRRSRAQPTSESQSPWGGISPNASARPDDGTPSRAAVGLGNMEASIRVPWIVRASPLCKEYDRVPTPARGTC